MKRTLLLLVVPVFAIQLNAQWTADPANYSISYTKGFVGVNTIPQHRFHVKTTDQNNASVVETNEASFIISKSFLDLRAKTGAAVTPSIGWYSPTGVRQALLGSRINGFGLTLENSNGFFISGGNVGIGVDDTRGYLLAVGGKMVAEEVVVKLKGYWPDYVFADDYNLIPIDSLSRFISIHRHLPGLPDQNEVGAQGINLNETTTLLLKKIEELTLYLIGERKFSNALMERISVLERNSTISTK